MFYFILRNGREIASGLSNGWLYATENLKFKNIITTRKHSSRMRTTRICGSRGSASRGGSAFGDGLPFPSVDRQTR